MPITPTYPGVYVKETSSGVRTITGVATSITPFIGRVVRGETNEPVTINNFGGFERSFASVALAACMPITRSLTQATQSPTAYNRQISLIRPIVQR